MRFLFIINICLSTDGISISEIWYMFLPESYMHLERVRVIFMAGGHRISLNNYNSINVKLYIFCLFRVFHVLNEERISDIS
jgi:hypothetical protein